MRCVTKMYQVLVVQLVLTVLLKSAVVAQEFYEQERDALIPFRDSMKSGLYLHGNWTGPPCRYNMSRWTGIGCSNSHVTKLTMESINMTGSLPVGFIQNITFLSTLNFNNNSISGDLPNLTSLMYLESVILSGNQFSGPIPRDYINLPRLTTLELQENDLIGEIPPFDQESLTAFNLSYNKLSGTIPETKVLERFGVSSFDHNPGLCGRPLEISCVSPSKDKKKALKIWSIVMIAAAAALVPFFLILLVFCCCRKAGRKRVKKEAFEEHQLPNPGVEKKSQWSASTDDPERTVDLVFFDKEKPVFDLDVLLRSSAEILGKGSLGTTYKATLESGLVVAVKRVKEMDSSSKKEFIQQMQLLGKLRHQNLVEIISFYYSKDEKLVVHEFIQDGSLFELLHGSSLKLSFSVFNGESESRGIGRMPLNWKTRVEMMKDVAKGLIFLHQSLSSQKVAHGNLKSSNVLVYFTGETPHAKLTDYGYLPLLPSQKSKLAIGKCPEIMDGKKPTHKSDVYCFGILLLEVITGRVPGENNHGDLSDWVRGVANADWSMDIFDLEILAEKDGQEDMFKLAELALECTDEALEKRPTMSQILNRLEEIQYPEINIEFT